MKWPDDIGRRIKLRDLHVLHSVVQLGSMTKAAVHLAISLPVVSKAIADLEQALGAPLLERTPQGVEPTRYGRALLTRTLVAFDELRQGVKDIAFLADPTAGEVRIGSTAPLAASFISTVIARLGQHYPRMMFRVVVSDSERLHRDLSERNLDLVVARRYGPLSDDRLAFELLYDDPFVVAAGVQSTWARRRKIELADLVNDRWALPPPETPPGSFITEAFRAYGLDLPQAKVVTFPYEVRTSLVATGRFLTVLQRSVLRFPTRHPFIKELSVKLPATSAPVGILTVKNRATSPVARLFIDSARDLATQPAKTR